MSHTPNTPANGGQILTDERIMKIRESIKPGDGWDGDQWDLALARAIEADLRAALAAPAIPTVDRNAVPSIRDSCDYADFYEDLLRLSEPGLNRKQAKVIRSSIVNTIDARVRAFASPVAQPAAQGAVAKLHIEEDETFHLHLTGRVQLEPGSYDLILATPAEQSTDKTAEGL